MNDLYLLSDPDPAVWFAVPNRYPDQDARDPRAWARMVAAEVATDRKDRKLLERILEDLARSENGRDEGLAYLFLPPDKRPMHLARLRSLPTEDLPDEPPAGPLEPATDVYDADRLGQAVRTVFAGLADEQRGDLLVTVAYRWTLGPTSVLLTLSTLDPGEAVAMVGELDTFADDVWVEDEDGRPVRADDVPASAGGE
ncbi:hypothetical protein AA0Y32_08730 [Georgenia phoenicis]|uniref:hypothetical protein n=1 Tax=unclassified Georgenia TaxID=2626815 RepID=UPI0039AFA004